MKQVIRGYWFKVIDMLQQNWALIDADVKGETKLINNSNYILSRFTYTHSDK